MFKLLTDNAREKAVKEYTIRRLIVGVGGVCSILLVGVIALFPSYIISKSRLNEAEAKIKTLKDQQSTQETQALIEWANDFNKEIISLNKIEKNSSPYTLFLNVINARPEGIKIKNLVFRNDTKSVLISVAGVASSRKNLYDFENILNNSGNFFEVIIPVSNFAKNSDIEFQFNLSPK